MIWKNNQIKYFQKSTKTLCIRGLFSLVSVVFNIGIFPENPYKLEEYYF